MTRCVVNFFYEENGLPQTLVLWILQCMNLLMFIYVEILREWLTTDAHQLGIFSVWLLKYDFQTMIYNRYHNNMLFTPEWRGFCIVKLPFWENGLAQILQPCGFFFVWMWMCFLQLLLVKNDFSHMIQA